MQKDLKIKPEKVGGFIDYLPPEMIARQEMIKTIETVYQQYGFSPLDTPAIEKLEVLTGNDPNFSMNLYRTFVAPGAKPTSEALLTKEADLALRYDLTVSLARVIAAYPSQLPRPFRRYQLGKVWRGERQQAGRFREFIQFDADIIGVKSMLAETEIIQLMAEVLQKLGFKNFLIKISNRKILEGFLTSLGVEKRLEVIRAIDKLTKESQTKIEQELINLTDSSKANQILEFIQLKDLKQAEAFFKSEPLSQAGFKELTEVVDNLNSLAVSNFEIDLSIVRGLGYYTSTVFEAVLSDCLEVGTVYAGGRYDGITNKFIPKSNIAGVGASVGLDRLFSAALKLKQLKLKPCLSQVLISQLDPDLKLDYLELAQQLRQAGIKTEIYLDPVPLKDQLAYAAKQEIPLVVIMGSDEKKESKITLKNMSNRSQQTIDKKDLKSKIEEQLIS